MKCPRCGHPFTPQHKFCSECGFPVTGHGGSPQHGDAEADGPGRLARAAGDYWRFVRMSLARPAAFSAGLGSGEVLPGLVTALFCSLFMANLFYLTAGNVFASFLGFFDFFPYRYGFLHHFVRPFFWMAVLHAITAGSIYVSARMMRSNLAFRDIVARYGALLAPPAVLFGMSSFFALIGAFRLVSLLSALGMIGWMAAAGYTVYGCGGEEQGGLDRFYGALAAFVIAGLALFWLAGLLF